MTNWMLRGLVFAAAMVVVRVFQGALINVFQTQAGLISIVLLILFIAGVAAWGVIDGRADAAANPDPDRRNDLAMTWLLAGLVAGIVSGLVSWLVSLVDSAMYVGGLINEITTFAAFTALVVFLAGIAGVTVGRYLIDRKGAYAPQGGGGEDRVDTDVFAAVRSDEAATEGGGWAEEQRSPVATAQREEHGAATAYSEEPTEAAPAYSEERTEEVPTRESSEPTEVIPTEGETTQAAPTEAKPRRIRRRSAKPDEDQA
jgi:hypothetical protein